MDEKDSERTSSTLDARLKQARQALQGKAPRSPRLRGEASGFGQAMRVGAELISGLVVGVILGWLFDRWFDTKPLMMIIFIFLGGAAGILNVFRTAMSMASDAQDKPKTGPKVGTENKPLGAGKEDSSTKAHEK
jgi:ATP synthase protein I